MSSEKSKPLKKEDISDEDDDDKPIGSRSRNVSIPKNTKVKKELSKAKKEESDDDFDDKPLANKSSTKPNKVPVKKNDKEDVKKKKGGKEVEVATVKKREKKVYDLPGQKRDPPEERDSLRIFYESLYEQVPTSEMAAIWMMESGLLPRDKAAKVLERKQKKAQQKLSSPMKSVVTVKKKGDSVSVKKTTTSTPASKQKKETPQTKKTPLTKVASQQSKKQKIEDSSSEEEEEDSSEEDSDNEVIAAPKNRKRQLVD